MTAHEHNEVIEKLLVTMEQWDSPVARKVVRETRSAGYGQASTGLSLTPLGRVTTYLLGNESGVADYPEVKWEEARPIRDEIIRLITEYTSRFEEALDKPSLRGWFIGKLAQRVGAGGVTTGSAILTMAFRVGTN